MAPERTHSGMHLAVGISGSPSAGSRSRRLLDHAMSLLTAWGEGTTLDLAALPAGALLGRETSPAVDDALEAVARTRVLVVSTPVYRASYSGLLKVFFDLLPQDGLQGKVAIPIATGGGPGHQLVLDHSLRPLLASVGATVVPTGVYGTDAQFRTGAPDAALLTRLEQAVAEAVALSGSRPWGAPAPSQDATGGRTSHAAVPAPDSPSPGLQGAGASRSVTKTPEA